MPNITSRLPWIQPKPLSPLASAVLDGIRAVAAWAVMWGHLRTLFFVDYPDVKHLSAPLKELYFATGFGHQAVVVFFVLSGFLVSSSIFKNLAGGTWTWVEYAIHRAARLYVVLIPGLILGVLWDLLGSHWLGASGLYSRELSNLGTGIARDNLTTGIFIGNFFFLQTIFCPTLGSNGPLWSLSNEFWYYVLFPVSLFAGIAWFRRSLAWAFLLSGAALFLAVFLGFDKLVGFLVWMTGCSLVVMYSKLALRRKRATILYAGVTSFLLCVCSTLERIRGFGPTISDLLLGLTFSLFLFGVLQMNLEAQRSRIARVSHLFAGFSYSLYVLHFPFLLCLRAAITPWHKWEPDSVHLFYGATVGGVTLLYSWAVSLVSEEKTSLVRGWIRGAVQRVSG